VSVVYWFSVDTAVAVFQAENYILGPKWLVKIFLGVIFLGKGPIYNNNYISKKMPNAKFLVSTN